MEEVMLLMDISAQAGVCTMIRFFEHYLFNIINDFNLYSFLFTLFSKKLNP
ncbi:MAG: hypothetical protein ACI85I_000157 [Arenicella sp.]|jgi:hypothetical protein